MTRTEFDFLASLPGVSLVPAERPDFGERLRRLRLECGLTQTYLALRAKRNEHTITMIECKLGPYKKYNTSWETEQALTRVLIPGIDPDVEMQWR